MGYTKEQIAQVFTKVPEDESIVQRLLGKYFWSDSNEFVGSFTESDLQDVKGFSALINARHPGLAATDLEVYHVLCTAFSHVDGDFSRVLLEALRKVDTLADTAIRDAIPLSVAVVHEWFDLHCRDSIEECQAVCSALGIGILTPEALKYFGVEFGWVGDAYVFDAYDVVMSSYFAMHGCTKASVSTVEAALFEYHWKLYYPGVPAPAYNEVLEVLGTPRICYDLYSRVSKSRYDNTVKSMFKHLKRHSPAVSTMNIIG